MAKGLSLSEWINTESVKRVAKLMSVNESTVRHWRRGFVLPRTEQMIKIKRLSKGRVTYDSMIDGHHSKT